MRNFSFPRYIFRDVTDIVKLFTVKHFYISCLPHARTVTTAADVELHACHFVRCIKFNHSSYHWYLSSCLWNSILLRLSILTIYEFSCMYSIINIQCKKKNLHFHFMYHQWWSSHHCSAIGFVFHDTHHCNSLEPYITYSMYIYVYETPSSSHAQHVVLICLVVWYIKIIGVCGILLRV